MRDLLALCVPIVSWIVLIAFGGSACSTGASNTGSNSPPATYLDGAQGDGGAVDGVGADAGTLVDGSGSGVGDGVALAEDSGGTSNGGNAHSDGGGPDAGSGGDDGAAQEPDASTEIVSGMLFAHTKDTLYTLDMAKNAMVEVAKFSFDKKKGLVTDIALDQFRNLWAVTFKDLFSCNADTAKCKWVAKLPKEFNGLTFIPQSLVSGSQQEALIGISEKGDWNWIKPDGKGGVTMKKLGQYGGGWLSSGDAFSVVGIGTFATLKKKSGGIDSLAKVDPKTGKLLKVIGSTGAKGLFGFAWWADVFYGFAVDGTIWIVDVKTGKANVASGIAVPKGVKWWGAGVSTRANGP